VRIARALHDELVAHAREDSPNECCGLIASRDGEAVRVVRVTNAAASPLRYEMEPREQLAAITAIDDDGLEIGAIYHSHTRSAPEPSQTDINLARNWPDPVYVIVGVAGPEDDVRAWRIGGDAVEQVGLDIVD
jgi:proteasome lid subunit RPN8/RPN11